MNNEAFLALLRAGLWEKDVELRKYGATDFDAIMRFAEEQSVVGLVTAGLEHIKDVKVPQENLLQFFGQTMRIEQRNKVMNAFIADLIEKLRKHDIYALLVKGQGIAQCYEKPLWRIAGDVDLLLSNDNYQKAKWVLSPIADEFAIENEVTKHQAMEIKGFEVELHGRMPFGMSRCVDIEIDDAMKDCFNGGHVSSWQNENTIIFVPAPDSHLIFVFTHFLRHFFIEGVGLRQICDWCRLLWTYRNTMDHELLESRIRKAGLMTEWKVFASLAVDTLGMPKDAMPFYNQRYAAKGKKVLKRVLKSGNFGHNKDLSYRSRYSGITYKIVAAWRRFVEFASLIPIFPIDAPKFFLGYMFNKM